MSACDEVGSDVHALIKKLAIRRVEHRSETHTNESQHLAEGTEVARLRRRFILFYSRYLCSERVTNSADKGWCLRAPGSSVLKARSLYTRIIQRWKPDPRDGKEQTGSVAGINARRNGDESGDGA